MQCVLIVKHRTIQTQKWLGELYYGPFDTQMAALDYAHRHFGVSAYSGNTNGYWETPDGNTRYDFLYLNPPRN